jgi:Protein of unknown function (DUF2817)
MPRDPEAPFPRNYRDARKRFIAACQEAHADSIARVHPTALGPDKKPLFIDSVALGRRDARKALLVIAGWGGWDDGRGSRALAELLEDNVRPPKEARLVLVHALNPFGAAWEKPENEEGVPLTDPRAAQSWSFQMLRAVLTEDLARAKKLLVLLAADRPTGNSAADALAGLLKTFRPGLDVTVRAVAPGPAGFTPEDKAALAKALAEL